MADISSYPIAIPTQSDRLLGTQVNELGEPITKSFLINGIMNLVPSVVSSNAEYSTTLASNFGEFDEFGNLISLSEAFANSVIAASTSVGFATAAQLTALSSIVTTQGNSITGNTISIATATNGLTTLATSVSAFAAEITNLSSIVTTQGSDIIGNASSIATANNSITTNATAIAASASDITNLTSTVVIQGNTLGDHTTSIATANSGITTNATNITANAASVTNLSAEIVLKPDVFRQEEPPVVTNAVGSIWYDTNDNNKVYILVAGTPNVWTESTDGRIITNISSLATANTAITVNSDALSAEASKVAELQSQFTFTGTNITGVSDALSTSIATASSNAAGAVASDLDKLEAVFSFNAGGDVDGTAGSLSTAITSSANAAIANASLASAQSVTDLSSTVNGNTSSINTTASTLATVEGYTKSRYSINLDAGGAVAGMSILAQNGATSDPYSEIRFNADKFKVFNNGTAGDATDYDAPFEVSGGVVKIKSANIGTISFGDLSNTPPTSYTTIVYATSAAGASPSLTKGTNTFYAIYQGTTQIDLTSPSAISALDFSQVTGDSGADGADGVDGVDGIDGIDGIDGTNGTNGTIGPDGARSFSGHLYYTTASTSAPTFSGGSVIFNFANNTFTNIPTGFSASAPEATPGSGSNNYWHVPVTVVEGSPNTITFGSVTRMFGFSGLVTFSGTTINNVFDYTAIDGGAITTGSIQSANYVALANSNYASTGTKIDLTNGSIESKNFNIDTVGNVEFSGNLTVGTTMTDGTISGGTISGTQFFGATGTFSGNITAAAGNIGGWSITGSKIYTSTMALNSLRPALEIYTGTEIVVDINASTSLSSIVPANPISSSATDTISSSDYVSQSNISSAAPLIAATASSSSPAGTLSSVNSQFNSGDILTFAHNGQSLTAANIASLTMSVRNSDSGTSTMTAGTFNVYTRVLLKSSIGGPTIATLQDTNLMQNIAITNGGGGATIQQFSPTLMDTTPKSTTFVYGGQANLYLYVETSVSFTASIYSDTDLSTYTATLYTYTPAYTCTLTKEISKTEISAGGLQVVRDQVNYVKMSRGSAATGAMVKVGGDITATGSITASASDRRLKDNITTIINPLDKINKLNGVYFNWNSIANDIAGFDTSTLNVGLIAQEVEEVLPEATTISPLDSGDGSLYKTIWYEKMVPLLLEGIKELSAKVDNLEQQLIK